MNRATVVLEIISDGDGDAEFLAFSAALKKLDEEFPTSVFHLKSVDEREF